MKSIGIDIGSSSIKIVELTGSNKGFHITDYFEHTLGQNPAFDSQIEILEVLRKVAARYAGTKTKFVCGLRQDRVSVRTKLFPFSDKIKILKSLPFELEEEVPFATEDAAFDNKIIRIRGKLTETLTVATPKLRVQEVLNVFKDSGIELNILSPEGLAFANCVENWMAAPSVDPNYNLEEGPTKELRHAKINLILGHTKTIVCTFENQKLIDVRTILWGGKLVADAIAQKYEIPYVEAIKEVNTKGFVLPTKENASYDQIVFSDVISKCLKELGRELQITLLELKADLNVEVENVQISGGVANIRNISALLTQMIEIPVNRFDPLVNYGHLPFEKNILVESKIGIALGLAIEGFKKPRNPAINFLRQEFARQSNSFQNVWKQWGPTIQLSAAMFLVFYFFSLFRESASLELADKATDALKAQAKSVAKLSGKQANEAGVRKYIKDQKKQIQDLKVLAGITQMNSAIEIVKRISDSAPPREQMQISVKTLRVEDDSVFIEGVVGKLTDINVLQRNLGAVALNGKVNTAPTTRQGPPNTFPFSMSFKVDRGIQTGKKL